MSRERTHRAKYFRMQSASLKSHHEISISLNSRWLRASEFGHFHFRFMVAHSIEAVVLGNLILPIDGRSRAHRLAIWLHTICTESGNVCIDTLGLWLWLTSRFWWLAGLTECPYIQFGNLRYSSQRHFRSLTKSLVDWKWYDINLLFGECECRNGNGSGRIISNWGVMSLFGIETTWTTVRAVRALDGQTFQMCYCRGKRRKMKSKKKPNV